jgi:hypothetical protein
LLKKKGGNLTSAEAEVKKKKRVKKKTRLKKVRSLGKKGK